MINPCLHVISLRFKAVIECKPLITPYLEQGASASTAKTAQQGKANGTFLRRSCARHHAENSVTLWIMSTRQMCSSSPKMRATWQSYSPQNSYISGTATEHKDVNTLKVTSRTNHFYCFAHLWQWLGVSVEAKLTVKMLNVTFEATSPTTAWGKFIYFIRRL